MTAVATMPHGITIERNTGGKAKYVRIDLNLYGNSLINFFSQEGIDISPYKDDFVQKIKRSEQQIANGQYKTIKTDDLWK
ncbi:hypothetical protein FACS1894156_0710 [Bacteroidia bacterium]|nr:hypothetical protein FACS1894156_0710 [Bacteroidia bacterium]